MVVLWIYVFGSWRLDTDDDVVCCFLFVIKKKGAHTLRWYKLVSRLKIP